LPLALAVAVDVEMVSRSLACLTGSFRLAVEEELVFASRQFPRGELVVRRVSSLELAPQMGAVVPLRLRNRIERTAAVRAVDPRFEWLPGHAQVRFVTHLVPGAVRSFGCAVASSAGT
jgi:hypothetical protein